MYETDAISYTRGVLDGINKEKAECLERIFKLIREVELPIGTTGHSIQEACRRAILQALKKQEGCLRKV